MTDFPIEEYKGWQPEGEWDWYDWHANVTITLGELVECGFIQWGSPEWQWDYYNLDQYRRLNKKIEDRYWLQEIGITPPGAWRRQFCRKMNEIMPRYKMFYRFKDALDELDAWDNVYKDFSETQNHDYYGKNRDVFSEFPATMIGDVDNKDFASDSRDKEYEDIKGIVRERVGGSTEKVIPWWDLWLRLMKQYRRDIDVMILDDLEILFTNMVTVNVNGY